MKTLRFTLYGNKKSANNVIYTSVIKKIISKNQLKCENNLTNFIIGSTTTLLVTVFKIFNQSLTSYPGTTVYRVVGGSSLYPAVTSG